MNLSGRPAPKSSTTSMVNCLLEGFVKAMALELGPVRVNAISMRRQSTAPHLAYL